MTIYVLSCEKKFWSVLFLICFINSHNFSTNFQVIWYLYFWTALEIGKKTYICNYRTYPAGIKVILETNPVGTLDGQAKFDPSFSRQDSGQNPIHRRSWLSRRDESRHQQQQQPTESTSSSSSSEEIEETSNDIAIDENFHS